MDEDRSFIDSDMGKAYGALLKLTNASLELTAAVPFAFAYAVKSVDESGWRLINDMFGFTAGKLYDSCKSNFENGFQTLNVFCLLESWGAFETFVEDASKAAIRRQRDLLSNSVFDKARRRVEQLQDLTDNERFERIIGIVISSQRDPLDATGNGKYEKQLGFGNIAGTVPTDLAEALMEGQQVRNVWAHNGGRADAKLLEQAPSLGYAIGEEVKITKPMLGRYLIALNTYTTIIVNRDRVQNGFAPLVCYGGQKNVFKASFDRLFPGAIMPVNLRDMSRSESDASLEPDI